jgi:hypothetical protein
MRLAGTGAADQHDIALLCQEVPACEIANQSLIDRRIVELEVVDILGQRQLGNGDLVLDRARLLLADLRRQPIAHHALRLVLTLDCRGDDLVEGGLHAVELQRRHRRQDLGSFHQRILLRLS